MHFRLSCRRTIPFHLPSHPPSLSPSDPKNSICLGLSISALVVFVFTSFSSCVLLYLKHSQMKPPRKPQAPQGPQNTGTHSLRLATIPLNSQTTLQRGIPGQLPVVPQQVRTPFLARSATSQNTINYQTHVPPSLPLQHLSLSEAPSLPSLPRALPPPGLTSHDSINSIYGIVSRESDEE